MVRTYKRKKDGPSWTTETMTQALADVKSGKFTAYGAIKHYGIKETTFRRHLNAVRAGCEVQKPGKPPILTKEEEREIELTCQLFAEWGFGLTKAEVVNVVADYCSYLKKPNPFRNGRPGNDWWKGFLKRHPGLTSRKPQQLQTARANAATKANIDHWFLQCLEPVLQNLQLLENPKWIFNVDETGFPLGGKPRKVIAKKGIKSPQSLVGGSGRDNITVQTCISGSGDLLPPYIVYAGKRLMANSVNGGPFGSRYSVTENGWMDTVTFIDWLQHHFIEYLPDDHPPVLLILDGHKSHISYEACLIAKENDVHLLKLPAHLSHLLQPLDVGVFKEMKKMWYELVADFFRRTKKAVTKANFPTLLRKVWQAYKPEYGVSGFRKAGVHPFNKDAVPQASLILSEPFHGLLPEQPTSSSTSSSPIASATSTASTSSPPIASLTSTASTSSAVASTSTSQACTSANHNQMLSTSSAASSTCSSQPSTNTAVAASHHATENQLRSFFGQLLRSTQPSNSRTASRRYLNTSKGESLTTDQALAQMAAQDEAKKQKEKERLERKRKKESQRTGKRKKKDTQQDIPASSAREQTRVQCLECEILYENDSSDEDWVECQTCLGWYHISCAGLDDLSEEEINNLDFICSLHN